MMLNRNGERRNTVLDLREVCSFSVLGTRLAAGFFVGVLYQVYEVPPIVC